MRKVRAHWSWCCRIHRPADERALWSPHNDVAPYAYKDEVAKALFNGDAPTRGAQLYVDRCAGCHRTDGEGYGRVFPPLAGNPLLQTEDATSAINIVLSGSTLPATKSLPRSLWRPMTGS